MPHPLSLRDYVQHKYSERDPSQHCASWGDGPCSCGLDALLSASPHDGWQTMETAPKDGTRILLGARHRKGRWLIDDGEWDTDTDGDGNEIGWSEWRYGGLGNGTPNPTHWMPLPAPPVLPAPERWQKPGDPGVSSDY